MKSAILLIAVFYSRVDTIFSDFRCYQCDLNTITSCLFPYLSNCSIGSYCLKETKMKEDEKSIYGCVGPGVDGRTSSYYTCDPSSYLCNFCEYDSCNRPPGEFGKVHKLRECYECCDASVTNRPEIFKQMKSCKNPDRKYCGIDQQCMVATTKHKKRLYRGCTILPPDEMCKKYNFHNCTACNGDLCNKPEGYTDGSRNCYECYTGNTTSKSDKFFGALDNCKNPSKKKCRNSEKCLWATSKIDGRRYHGCSSNNVDEFCKKYGFAECKICDYDLCNKVVEASEEKPLICHQCYTGNTSAEINTNFRHKPNCSKPSTKQCQSGFKCVEAYSKNEEERYHGCTEENNFCELSGFDHCQICNRSLCNKVKNAGNKTLKLLQCYDCYSRDVSSSSSASDNIFKGRKLCSNPSKTKCAPEQQCAEATGDDGKRFHGCMFERAMKDSECKKLGFDHCTTCTDDLCNEVDEDTKRRKSSAMALTKNSLLIILIICRTALLLFRKE